MPIVFAAITPHSPLLIPSVGKENLSLFALTLNAYKTLADDLYASQADTVIIISPHGAMSEKQFSINFAHDFLINFDEFGDFETKMELPGDFVLATKLKESIGHDADLRFVNEPKLDHGTSVPLFLLAKNLPQLKIIPIYYSAQSLAEHFKFGQILKRKINSETSKKIAIIASGDLSHSLNKKSPAGYSPKGKKFDQKLIESLSKNNVSDILALDPGLVSAANECGLKSIMILLGILDGMKHDPEVLSYEFPFGIGHLAVRFRI